jgi:hypothetical protein
LTVFETLGIVARRERKTQPISIMSEPPQKIEGVSFLGITVAYPRTFWGTLPYAFVCATIVLVTYFLAPHAAPARRLWLPIVVETNGSQMILGDTRQMNFWTPSARTGDFITKSGGPVSAPDKWQVIASDEPVMQFGLLLHSNANVFGYRRTEVWGRGRTIFKPGWWWTVNVTTNYSVAELGNAYQAFWKCSSPVFIEAVDNRGSEP